MVIFRRSSSIGITTCLQILLSPTCRTMLSKAAQRLPQCCTVIGRRPCMLVGTRLRAILTLCLCIPRALEGEDMVDYNCKLSREERPATF